MDATYDNRQDSSAYNPDIYDALNTEEPISLLSYAFDDENLDPDMLDEIADFYYKRMPKTPKPDVDVEAALE